MGNWRTVTIKGTCEAKDLPALKQALDPGEDFDNFHCLSNTTGLCGLGMWANETITASGNLAERDYSVEDVAKTLEDLAKVAPSLAVKVHCGGDYEDKLCIATVTLAHGKAVVGEPEVVTVEGVSDEDMQRNLMAALMRPQRF